MPKITVMSAEKAFLSAHYGGPFNKEDYIIVSITDTRYEADCPVVFRPIKNLKYVFRVPFIDIAASKLDPRKTVEEQTGLDLPVFSKTEARKIKAIGDFAKKYDYHILVHCEAGVSRSQAVGACLELYVNKDASNVERRIHSGNYTHKNQLTIENYKGNYRLSNQLMPHISVPLSVFETSSNLENTFKVMASFFENMAYSQLDFQMANKLL